MFCGSKKLQTTNQKPPKQPWSQHRTIMNVRRALCAASTTILITLATQVKAEDISVCVICNDPGKVYQCSYNDPYLTNSTINLSGLQFACIKEVAQYGNHGQCAAARKSITECNGLPYTLKHTAGLYKPDQTPEENAELQEQPPKKQPPTLVDSTTKTYNQTKETIQNGYKKTTKTVKKTVKSVGNTIGDAASTTYDCITSFFKKC